VVAVRVVQPIGPPVGDSCMKGFLITNSRIMSRTDVLTPLQPKHTHTHTHTHTHIQPNGLLKMDFVRTFFPNFDVLPTVHLSIITPIGVVLPEAV
jgi:hypothetical protein